jgi:TIR domain
MSSEERAVIRVFCSYSDEDRPFQERLEKHPTSLVRVGSVLVWDKHKIKAGQERQREIDDQWKQARLILLLISSNFISSDDCYAGDLVRALQW